MTGDKKFRPFANAIVVKCQTMMYALTCRHCCIDKETKELKQLCLVKVIKRGVESEMIMVVVAAFDEELDLALLHRMDGMSFDCPGIALCPADVFPKHTDRNNEVEIYSYNIADFNDGNDEVLSCCLTSVMKPKIITENNMKLPILLNCGASGGAVVYCKNSTLVAVYQSYVKIAYTVADGKKHLEDCIEDKCDKTERDELKEDISEMDATSAALSKTSSRGEHSSYACFPVRSDVVMEVFSQERK